MSLWNSVDEDFLDTCFQSKDITSVMVTSQILLSLYGKHVRTIPISHWHSFTYSGSQAGSDYRSRYVCHLSIKINELMGPALSLHSRDVSSPLRRIAWGLSSKDSDVLSGAKVLSNMSVIWKIRSLPKG